MALLHSEGSPDRCPSSLSVRWGPCRELGLSFLREASGEVQSDGSRRVDGSLAT